MVEDGGPGPAAAPGLGLALVRRLVEEGLRGTVTSEVRDRRYRVGILFPLGEEAADHAGAHR